MSYHFAVVAQEGYGHINPMATLATELVRRGHRITWICSPAGLAMVHEHGFLPIVVGTDVLPMERVEQIRARLGSLRGMSAARFTLQALGPINEIFLAEVPPLIRETEANVLISDETVFTSRTIADIAGIPWITVCCALPIHPGYDVSPAFMPWKYWNSPLGRLRNRMGHQVSALATWSMGRWINRTRSALGFRHYNHIWENASDFLTIAQVISAFDFNRQSEHYFHSLGAFHDRRERPPVDFPFHRLDGRPLIYASMGTVQNRLADIYQRIAEACEPLSLQLVISTGGGLDPDELGPLRGEPIVVRFAPQLELIERAELVITHGGMNTVNEAIAAGCPMVAIPITNDQPGVATRIEWSGCGLSVPIRRAGVHRLRSSIRQVLHDPKYRQHARRLAVANRTAGGVEAAADLIESSLAQTAVQARGASQ